MVVGFICGLLSTRLIVTEVGTESYALFSLVAALPALIPFSDLGTGAVLVNGFATSDRPRADTLLKRQILSVGRIMLAFAGAVILLNTLIYALGLWPSVLGAAGMHPAAAAVAFTCVNVYAISIPLGLWGRVLLGLRRNHIIILIQGAQPALTLLFVWAMISINSREFAPWIAISTFASSLLITVVGFTIADRNSGGLLTAMLGSSVRPPWRRGARVMDVGWPMLAQTLTPPLSTQAVRFVVAQSVTVTAIAQYGLLNQIFLPLTGLISAVGTTLWPYYSRARNRGESAVSPFVLSAIFSGGAAVATGAVMIVGPWLFELTSGGLIDVPTILIAAFGLQLVCRAAVYPLGMYLMSPEGIRFQVLPALLMAFSSLGLTTLAAPTLGISSAPISAALATLVFQIIPFVWFIRREQRHS